MKISTFLITITYMKIINSEEFALDDDNQLFFSTWELFYSPLDIFSPRNYTLLNNCRFAVAPKIVNILCGNTCTSIPKHLNITTPLLKIELTHIQKIGSNDLGTEVSALHALVLEGNVMLKHLESGCFKHFTNLVNLTLISNPKLSSLDKDVFNGLVNLKILCLSKNGFTHVIDVTRACSANNLPKLNLLSFEEHTFNEIGMNEFLPMAGSNLKQLNLNICQIKYIHPYSLVHLKNITALRLCQNLFNRTTLTNLVITTLESGIKIDILNLFQVGLRNKSPYKMLTAVGKTKLRTLVLAGNTFNSIDNNWFPSMLHLTLLDIRMSLIIDIEDNAFDNIPNLTNLRCGGNRFTEFPRAVTKLKYLELLEMTGKFDEDQSVIIFTIPDGSFQNLTNLHTLKLGYKNIGSISRNLFKGAVNLTRLCLKSTSLSFIEEGAFSHLPNLKYLNLIHNSLLQTMPLNSEVFRGLGNLKVLLLGGCSLKNLTASVSLFAHLVNLTHLGLEANDISVISPNQLSHLQSLKTLHLCDNLLAPWSKRILPAPNLKVLYARQNKFTYVTTTMLEDWKNLDELYLQDNPLFCDCSLYPVIKWRRANSMSLKILQTDDFVANCMNPEEWRHKSIVNFLGALASQENICKNSTLETYKTLIILLVIGIIVGVIIAVLLYLNRWYLRYWFFLCRLNFMKYNPWKQQNTHARNNLQYDAFVSYCNTDRLFVMQMIAELENKEPALKLCIYERDFSIGTSISQAILQSISSSRRTILVVSNDFVKSNWCQWESQLAEFHQLFFNDDDELGLDDTLILVKFSNLQTKALSPTLKYLLRSRIYLTWELQDSIKQEQFWNKMKMVLTLPKRQLKEIK